MIRDAVLILLNVGVALGVLRWVARRRGARLPGRRAAAMMVLAAAIGSVVSVGAIELVHYRGHVVSWLVLGAPGGSILGAILACLAVGHVVLRREPDRFWEIAIPCLWGLGAFSITQRLLCFYDGCCFGMPAGNAWGIVFRPGTPAAERFPGVALHPTQLYSAAAAAGILLVLAGLERTGTSPRLMVGSVVALFGLERVLSESLRFSPNRHVVGLFDGSPVTGHALLALALVGYGACVALSARDPRPGRARREPVTSG